MGKFLKIKEWEKYQHYKDRNPPWIKLHRELLTSYTWTALDDSDRLLAIVCMILAADTDNKIPLDRDFIKRRAQLRGRPDVRNLVEVGFAEIVDEQGCSTMPQTASNSAQSVQNVRPETEAETELPISKKRARRLPEDFIPKPEHYTLGHELRVIVDTEFQVFRDHFLGTGAAKIDWDATLRNWLRRSVKFGGANGASRQTTKAISNTQTARYGNNGNAIAQAKWETSEVGSDHAPDGAGQATRPGPGSGRVLEGEVKPIH